MQRCKFLLVIFILGAIAGAKMVGQDFLSGPICTIGCAPDCMAETQQEYIRHYEVGNAFALNVGLPPGVNSVDEWRFLYSPTTGGDCGSAGFSPPAANGSSENLVGTNLQATFTNGFNGKVVVNGTSSLPAGEQNITLKLVAGGNTYVRNYRLIIRRPTDIVFALDRSGSMECDVDEDVPSEWAGCITLSGVNDGRRWDILSEAVDNFILNLDVNHTLSSDRLSVVYFDGNTAAPSALVNDTSPFNSVANFKGLGGTSALRTELDNMLTGGSTLGRNGTSIGAGLFKAIDGRYAGTENAARRQIVLLFTDGEQNTGNWIKDTGPDRGRKILQNQASLTEVLNLNDATIDGIEVLVAGTIYTGSSPSLLEAIAGGPSSYFNVLPGEEGKFGSDFSGHAFNEIFNQASPRFIGSKEYELSRNSGNIRADFMANHNVNRTLFQVNFSNPIARRSKVKIIKDGVDVTSKGEIRVNNYTINFVFPLYELADLPSAGTWTVEVLPPPARSIPAGTKVNVFATADDHAVRFTAGTVEDRLEVDKPFRPELELAEEGKPITNATIKATIIKPGDDLGDLLARTSINQIPSSNTESGTCADRKYAQLRKTNSSALNDLFNLKRNTISLSHKAGGRYEGVYNNTDVTGIYKIRYEIAYTSPRLGEIRRMVEQTRYVNFPPPTLNLTALNSAAEREKFNQVTSRPSYKVNGNQRFIGPGYANAFGVTGENVRLNTVDNCEGTYQLRVTGPPAQKFKLFLLEHEVFEGTVKEFNEGAKKPGWQLGLHAGLTYPQGVFDRRFDEGYYGEVSFGKRIGSTLGIDLVGGYYGFEPDYKVLGGTVYLNGYLSGGGVGRLMVGVGPGYYFPDAQDARLGGSLRAALERDFGKLTIGVEGAYFRLADPELEFATLGLELKFNF